MESTPLERFTPTQTFYPHRLTRNGHIQTVLARRYPTDSLAVRLEQPMILDAGPDETEMDPGRPVRLLGYYTPTLRHTGPRGLVLILHGWEGSSHSADVQFIADALLRAGYATFRLNMRDHGPRRQIDPHALNRGLFLGTLINEVATAARRVALLAGEAPLSIVGGSMGGNFALRIAALHNQHPIPNLQRVIAVCPAVQPGAAVRSMDARPAYRNYFRRRWLASLFAKERHFPDLYAFEPLRRMQRVDEITEWLVPRYSAWRDATDYYAHYAFTAEMAASLSVRTTIIAARNDAIIPYSDFLAFAPHEALDIHLHPTGGHMGFVDLFPYRRWLPTAVCAMLEEG